MAKLTAEEKYRQLKKHTEDAGMKVEEKDGKIVVTRVRGSTNGKKSSVAEKGRQKPKGRT